MISVVAPYWNRPFALTRSLALFALHYADLDMEVVIVDDGSQHVPVLDTYPFPVRIVRLAAKTAPLCPCLPINTGVEVSRGDVLVITNPEILHHTPVFPQMRESLTELGPDGYVLAAAYCREQQKWHCHSEHCTYDTPMPPGFGLHFCAMLHRSLWDRAGGFDPDYREGNCFDDNDFAWRLFNAGATPLIRDDLKVEHPKSGARTAWPREGWERNRKLFFSNWPQFAAFA